MKSATEPLKKLTKYEEVEDIGTDEDSEKRREEGNPNAIDFSLFDDKNERLIDNDYHMLE